MSQNGQTHFKNLAAFVSDHIWALSIKGLRQAKRGNAEPTRKLRSD